MCRQDGVAIRRLCPGAWDHPVSPCLLPQGSQEHQQGEVLPGGLSCLLSEWRIYDKRQHCLLSLGMQSISSQPCAARLWVGTVCAQWGFAK